MRAAYVIVGLALVTASTAHAGSQSSNTSSNSSSNNGVVRERLVDTYCADGYCTRYAERRVSRDDRRQARARDRRHYDHFRGARYEDDDD